MSTAARIDELRKKFEENPRRYFAPLANEFRKTGELAQAIALCREHLPKQPGHMSGYIVFGQALYESGDLAEARSVFEQALALDPENLIALRHLGDIARASGDAQSARRWYERVLDADPRNDDIAAQLATLATGLTPASVPAVASSVQPFARPMDTPHIGMSSLGFSAMPTPDSVMRAVDFDEINARVIHRTPIDLDAIDANATSPSTADAAVEDNDPFDFDDAAAATESIAEPQPDVSDATMAAPLDGVEATSFEEGLMAPEWPDTSDLVARVTTPRSFTPRSATPLSVEATTDAVSAFGREAGDPIHESLTPAEPVESLVEPAYANSFDDTLAAPVSAPAADAAGASDDDALVEMTYVESAAERETVPTVPDHELIEFSFDDDSVAFDASSEPSAAVSEHQAEADVLDFETIDSAQDLPADVISATVSTATPLYVETIDAEVTNSFDDSFEDSFEDPFEDSFKASTADSLDTSVAASNDEQIHAPTDIAIDATIDASNDASTDASEPAIADVELPWLGASEEPSVVVDEFAASQPGLEELAEAFAADARAAGDDDIVTVAALDEVAERTESEFTVTDATDTLDDDDMPVQEIVAEEHAAYEQSSESPAFVTETMGELLVSQGFVSRAADVYEELVRRRPFDQVLTSRLQELREMLAADANSTHVAESVSDESAATEESAPLMSQDAEPTSHVVNTPPWSVSGVHPVMPTPSYGTPAFGTPAYATPIIPLSAMSEPAWVTPPRVTPYAQPAVRSDAPAHRLAGEWFATVAARRVPRRTPAQSIPVVPAAPEGLASLFGAETSVNDDAAARALADAFAPVSAADLESGATLDFEFARSTPAFTPTVPAPAAPAPTPPSGGGGNAGFSFDKFFPDPAIRRGTPSAPSAAAPEAPVTDDLAQFSAWLKGLGNT